MTRQILILEVCQLLTTVSGFTTVSSTNQNWYNRQIDRLLVSQCSATKK